MIKRIKAGLRNALSPALLTMKLFIVFFILLGISSNVKAASQSAFQLNGNVVGSCLVDIDPTPLAGNLDLTGTGYSNAHVADVKVFSNYIFRTVVKIKDTHGGKLVHKDNNTYTVPFTINYVSSTSGGKNSYQLKTNFETIEDHWHWGRPSTPFQSKVYLNLVGNSNLPAGVYEDTITISCDWH